ncbi:MAG: excalibur calcium-binding domain-containing protein [Nocardioides sp.]|uniref:excalibur calcium-binding domain-containing protein n=1 Tax=Nocardioides sp. TaxID=35761 RepID=UPI0039E4245A
MTETNYRAMARPRLAATLTALALTLPGVALVATAEPAGAAEGKYYSSCDKLHKDFKHGVAKSAKAAQKQVRQGYGRPSTTKKAKAVYKTNKSRLDRDNDGTACEA